MSDDHGQPFPGNPLGLTRDQIIQSDLSRYARLLGSSPLRAAFDSVVAEMPWWVDGQHAPTELSSGREKSR